jgi:hypothetical protein
VTNPVRRAGRSLAGSGLVAIWSVAEGRRGRRWRETITGAGGLVTSLLFETDPGRRFAHLELSTASGLLTLHPERDGTLHGNAITASGVRHISRAPWQADGFVLVEPSIVCLGAAIHNFGTSSVGESIVRAGISIDSDLGVTPVEVTLDRTGDGWRIDGRSLGAFDEDGLPDTPDSLVWPLELAG